VPHRGAEREISGVLLLTRDVTDERASESARSKAEQRFEIAFERAPIGMVMVRADGRFERVNHALCRLTGYDKDRLQAMAPFEIVHEDDRDAVRSAFAALGQGVEDLAVEHRCLRADGGAVWVSVRASLIRDADGAPLHALAQVQDIDEQRRQELELRRMADHDPLTGLFNRRRFDEALEDHADRVRRYGAAGAVLMLDLDGFKTVNDTLGHRAGDALLVSCAQALRARLRDSDVVARLGGDEFAVLLPAGGRAAAEIVARDLLDVIRKLAAGAAHETERRVTISIGVATFQDASAPADHVLALADRALYDAKRTGRGRHVVAS
jgi:diguanylate cyclase (GGDEF)-like protein/PAS domain S-box-containing protein